VGPSLRRPPSPLVVFLARTPVTPSRLFHFQMAMAMMTLRRAVALGARHIPAVAAASSRIVPLRHVLSPSHLIKPAIFLSAASYHTPRPPVAASLCGASFACLVVAGLIYFGCADERGRGRRGGEDPRRRAAQDAGAHRREVGGRLRREDHRGAKSSNW